VKTDGSLLSGQEERKRRMSWEFEGTLSETRQGVYDSVRDQPPLSSSDMVQVGWVCLGRSCLVAKGGRERVDVVTVGRHVVVA
jgi:hypothetical protein